MSELIKNAPWEMYPIIERLLEEKLIEEV